MACIHGSGVRRAVPWCATLLRSPKEVTEDVTGYDPVDLFWREIGGTKYLIFHGGIDSYTEIPKLLQLRGKLRIRAIRH